MLYRHPRRIKLGVLCDLRGSGFSLFMNRQERKVREEVLTETTEPAQA
jgi:hypothetical protein